MWSATLSTVGAPRSTSRFWPRLRLMSDVLDRLAAYWYSLRYQHTEQILARIQYWLGWKLYPRFPSMVRMCCEQAKRPSSSFSWPGSPTSHPSPGYPIDWNPPD